MSPKAAVPTPVEGIEETPTTLEKLLAMRGLMFGILGGVALIVVVVVVVLVYGYTSRKADDAAWATLYRTVSELRNSDPTNQFLPDYLVFQSLDADVQVRAFSQLAEEVRGSSAEPFALYHLASAHIVGRKLDDAERILTEIQDRFPRHYLVDSSRYYFRQSLVEKALDDCRKEREFAQENPDFLKGVPLEKEAGKDDGAGDPEDHADEHDPDEDSSEESESGDKDDHESEG